MLYSKFYVILVLVVVAAALSHWPVPLTEGGDVGEALVTGRVVVSIGGTCVWHRGPLFLLIAPLGCLLLIVAQLQFFAVYQQGLMGERMLKERKKRIVFFFNFSFSFIKTYCQNLMTKLWGRGQMWAHLLVLQHYWTFVVIIYPRRATFTCH